MAENYIAKASTKIRASQTDVWSALTDPEKIRQFMFGTNVTSDFKKGSPITWKGEWQGKAYEDKGTILDLDAPRLLRYSHFSPLMGKPDRPENYHNVTIELKPDGPETNVTLTQDNNATEEAKAHSEKNWTMMLESLKKLLEHS